MLLPPTWTNCILNQMFISKTVFDMQITNLESIMSLNKKHILMRNQSRSIIIKILFTSCVLIIIGSNIVSYAKVNENLNEAKAWQKIKIGHFLGDKGEHKEAKEYFLEAVELFEKEDAKSGLSVALHSLGCSYRNLGYFEEALYCYKRSLSIDKSINRLDYLATDYNSMALVYTEMFQYDSAIEYYHKSLELSEKVGNIKGKAACYNNMSALLLQLGNLHKSLIYITEALSLYMEEGYVEGILGAYNGLGNIFFYSGDYQRSLYYYLTARTLLYSSDNKILEAKVLYGIGNAYLRMGKIKKAKKFFIKSGEIFIELGTEANKLYEVAFRLMDIDFAEDNISQVKKNIEKIKESFYEGRLHLKLENYLTAKNAFANAISLYEPYSIWDKVIPSYIGRAIAFENLGQFQNSIQDLIKAVNILESQRATGVQHIEFFGFESMGFSRLDAYEGLVRILNKSGKYEESFYWSEYTKARVFLDAISRSSYNSNLGIDKSLRHEEQKIENQILSLEKRIMIALQTNNDELLKKMTKESEKLKSKQKNLIDIINRESPEYALIRYSQPVSISEIQLKKNEVLVEFDVTDQLTLIFIIRKGKIDRTIQVDITRKELAEMVNQFRELFMKIGRTHRYKPFSEAEIELGFKLYKLLLKEVLENIEDFEQILIIPDEFLCLVPFEAFVKSLPANGLQWNAKGKGKFVKGVGFVGDERIFSYWQSASSLTVLRNFPQNITENKILAIADPIFDEDEDENRMVKQKNMNKQKKYEMKNLNFLDIISDSTSKYLGWNRFPKLNSINFLKRLKGIYKNQMKNLIGLEVNESRLKAEDLLEYGAGIIFSTHGIVDERIPYFRQPALILSNPRLTEEISDKVTGSDGYLTMSEIMNLKISTEIVAALACGTGVGRVVQGEGVMSLGRAFQYAGARSVLVSLWSVEDKSTNILGERFFAGLKNGEQKETSLFEARRLLKQQGYEHPLYWAGFILIGERDMLQKENKPYWIRITWLIIIAISLMLLGRVLYRQFKITKRLR